MRGLPWVAMPLLLAGCVSIQAPLSGILYSDTRMPTALGDGAAAASKTGQACAKGVLGVVWGDASIEAAKAAGGITRVAYVDHTQENVLLVYAKYCTVVRGE